MALPLLPTGNPAYQTSPGAGAFPSAAAFSVKLPRKFEPPRVPRAICTCHFWIFWIFWIFWLFSFHFTPDTSLMNFGYVWVPQLGARRTSFTNSARGWPQGCIGLGLIDLGLSDLSLPQDTGPTVLLFHWICGMPLCFATVFLLK